MRIVITLFAVENWRKGCKKKTAFDHCYFDTPLINCSKVIEEKKRPSFCFSENEELF